MLVVQSNTHRNIHTLLGETLQACSKHSEEHWVKVCSTTFKILALHWWQPVLNDVAGGGGGGGGGGGRQ